MPENLRFDLGGGGLGLLATIGGIILIDIVLSGDNALVIGAAASRLPRTLRFLAILWGGAGAIILRVALAGAATLLLQVPLLQAIGGVVLVVIAVHLLLPQEGPHIQARDRFWPAVATILVADVTMSLDNVIAIGALAKGNLVVLGLGLLVSMAVLFIASAVIARIIERLSVLLDLASLVLAYTAANLVLADPLVGPRIAPFLRTVTLGPVPGDIALNLAFVLAVLLADIGLRVRRAEGVWRRSHEPLAAPDAVVDALIGVARGPVTLDLDGDAADAELAVEDLSAAEREPVASQPLTWGAEGDADLPGGA